MALKNPIILYIGIAVLLVVFILAVLLKRKARFAGGSKVANTHFVRSSTSYRMVRARRVIVAVIMELALATSIVSGLVLASRPVVTEATSNGTKKRDIFLCMDVSYSIYALNYDLVESLEEVVRSLDGDRFGISIFNTSTVLYVPMTDDYDFVISKLEELKEYFKLQQEYMENYEGKYLSDIDTEAYYKIRDELDYYDAGTLVNNYSKGSSLVGEGLATALFSFPRISDEDRTRIIILSTDNSQEEIGTPIVEIDEACSICADHGIRVFGVFPAEEKFYDRSRIPYSEAMNGLMKAVSSTGGTFYRESDTLSVQDMVDDIQAQEALMVDEVTTTRVVDKPMIPTMVLLIALAIFFIAAMVLML